MQKHFLCSLICLLIGFLLLGGFLYYDRGRADRVSELNQQLADQLNSANGTIAKLRDSEQIKQRSIDKLTADNRQAESRIKQLTELGQQQRDIIGKLTAAIGGDSKDLRQLQEIIEKLPKAK